jgi:tRNA(Ile)-lysidine synthase
MKTVVNKLTDAFINNWNKHFTSISLNDSFFFIAVSGGVDSIVLTDLIAKITNRFTILHCNFNLRNEESKRDEQFVFSLQNKYNTTVLIKEFNTTEYVHVNNLSIQTAARNLRYNWFKEVMDKKAEPNIKCYLLTAHHADDNIETVLMNIFRGTGLKGLHGISLQKDHILRPLLFARKTDILDYAKQNNLKWVEDSSNVTDNYTRNYLRLHIIPLLKNLYSASEENLISNIEKWKEAEIIYNLYIQEQKQKILVYKGKEIHIPVLKLKQQKALKTILFEIVSEFGFTTNQLNDIVNLIDATTGKYIESSTHRVIKNRKWLIIAPLNENSITHFIIDEGDNELFFSNKKLTIAKVNQPNIQNNENVACLDSKNILFPLILRKWRQGDYFYPLGMDKKKKVSRFLIDTRLSMVQKEDIWVLETNKKIIWVVGLRIDNRFKINSSSTSFLQFTVE